MKKIILVLNHTQAGMGSDENAHLGPAGKKAALGPGQTLAPYFKEHDSEIIATLYCGDQYFLENQEEVIKKFVGISRQFGADGVLCGPAMQYPNFGEMSAKLALAFNQSGIPAAAAMSAENPAIAFKDQVKIIKMPKKGGVGLNESFKRMAQLVSALAHGEEVNQLVADYCF